MALQTPSSASDVIDRMVLDQEAALSSFGGKPALKNSWLNSLIRATANRIFDYYFALDTAAREALPDTAVANLDRWAAIWGVTRIAGVVSIGNVIAEGVVASVIPIGAGLVDGAGKEYLVTTGGTVAAQSVSVTFIGDQLNGFALAATPVPHNLADGVLITVTGAVETEYNVTNAVVNVLSDVGFEYPITGSPASPGSGTIFVASDTIPVAVESVAFGEDEDQPEGSILTWSSPLVGVNSSAGVDAGALTGGSDQETDEQLRARLLDRIQNPVAHFSVSDIVATAKTVAGVTRVFVREVTPTIGQVTVHFMRDNDVTPIPGAPEVAAVRAVLNAIRPANTAEADLIVEAPAAVVIPFTFTSLSPNTTTMRDAIQASLVQFFAERTSVGEAVTSDGYRSAIFNTVDTTNGDIVNSFMLSTPSGDLAMADNEIGQLGNVTFSI